jgi:hypothetical protein
MLVLGTQTFIPSAEARFSGLAVGFMTKPVELVFNDAVEGRLLLPRVCSLSVSCYEAPEVREAVAVVMEEVLYALALNGMDLRALDGITFSRDCRAAAMVLQGLPEGQNPLELGHQPDTMEMARTVAVWRGKELRFHIVFRAGVGLMTMAQETGLQAAAEACIAHEAAHVEHEGHLYRTFPGMYGCPLECGNRSRRIFMKAMDVWSEYAACRSSARFRPEAVDEFEGTFCRAVEEAFETSCAQVAKYRLDRSHNDALTGIPELFGDVFVHAGYFLGHLDGLELSFADIFPRLKMLFQKHPKLGELIVRLRQTLEELWLSESSWTSIGVFTPIYDLILEMLMMQGLALTKHEGEWRPALFESLNGSEH